MKLFYTKFSEKNHPRTLRKYEINSYVAHTLDMNENFTLNTDMSILRFHGRGHLELYENYRKINSLKFHL